MTNVSKSTSPSTTSTTRAVATPTKPTATTPTATKPSASRQPDLDGKADSARLLGTTPRSAVPAVPVAADAALKSQLDAARATGNPNPQKSMTGPGTWQQPFATTTKYVIGDDLATVRVGGTLCKGNSGPGVEDLQGRLNTALKGTGANSLATDGLFGPKTEANLRIYQESRGLPVTGVLDALTVAALEGNKTVIAGWQPSTSASVASSNASSSLGGTADTSGVVSASTAGMNEQQKFDHYKAMIERSGGRFNPNGPNIVGVRTPTNGNTNGGGGRYDDTFAVITMKGGRPTVQEFRGNTEPAGSYRGRMGQDANGDGRIDQGQLRPGFYEYASSSYRGGPALRMRGDSVVDRDTNRDGTFGNDGGATSRGGASMLFHRGGNNTTGSAGCQTMAPAEFDRFMGALRNAGMGAGGAVGYTLVNGG